MTNVHTIFSGSCLSDHFPFCFLLQIHCLNSMPSLSPCPAKRLCIDWSNAAPSDLENYCNMVSMNLPAFPSEVSRCVSTDCSCHYNILDTYAEHNIIVHTLHDSALHCIPSHTTPSRRLVGWKDGAGVYPTFGIRCGLRLGALCLVCYLVKNAKRRYKYAHRRLKAQTAVYATEEIGLLLFPEN